MDRTMSLQMAKGRQQELIEDAHRSRWAAQMRRRAVSRQQGPLRILRLQRA